jgi:hypothetical protein
MPIFGSRQLVRFPVVPQRSAVPIQHVEGFGRRGLSPTDPEVPTPVLRDRSGSLTAENTASRLTLAERPGR